MRVQEIQSFINKYPYEDARTKKLECNYFADEITLIYESTDDKDVCCQFIGCFKSVFDHNKTFDKLRPVKNMNYGHMPYFIFDIVIGEALTEGERFYTCKIDLGLLEVEIWCKDIVVSRINKLNTAGKTCFEFN